MTEKGFVLVTGGAGYVGQHVIVELVSAGYQPVAVDIRADALEGGSRLHKYVNCIDLDVSDPAGAL